MTGLVVGTGLLVGDDAAQAHEHVGLFAAHGVEGRRGQAEEALGALAEVQVEAAIAQLVVVLDGSLGGLNVDAVELGEQLVDGVGGHALARVDAVLDVLGAADGNLEAVGGVVGQGLVAVVASRAVGGRKVLELLGPSGVEELVGHVAGLLLKLVLELLTGQVLVHEALAGKVEPQIAVVADDTAAADAGAAAHVVNHRGVPLLQRNAGPSSHLVAVARGGVVAFDVHRGVHDGHLVLHDGGHEVLEHSGVVGVDAASEDDAALGGCLDGLAGGGVAGVDAAATAVLHDELRAEVAVADVDVAVALASASVSAIICERLEMPMVVG